MRGLTRIALLTGLSIGLATLPAVAAEYVEPFEGKAPEAMFEGKLLLGASGPWTGEVKEGAYFLIDRETPGAVKAITLAERARAKEPVTVSVDVLGQFEGQEAGAGLHYGASPDGSGFAFVVTPNGSYAVYRLEGNRLQRISQGTNPAIRPAAVNRLSARIEGQEADLQANGQTVFVHQQPEGSAPFAGSVGIIAIDLGAYSFDDFSLSGG